MERPNEPLSEWNRGCVVRATALDDVHGISAWRVGFVCSRESATRWPAGSVRENLLVEQLGRQLLFCKIANSRRFSMLATDATLLIHLVGFMTGIVLYAMLGVMTLRASGEAWSVSLRVDRVPLVTAILGLSWNCGALVIYGLRDLGVGAPPPLLTAFAFSSLGFLPAVVVHSAFPSEARARGGGRMVVAAAYLVSTVAGALQVRAAFRHDALPWPPAMVLLTVGYLIIIGLLVIYSSRQPAVRRALSGVALAAFAVMALHLGQHATSSDTWPIELVGHHASLPLALVILYQDYRFALADLFLKRALSLLALIGLWMALYLGIAAPYVLPRMAGDWTQPLGVGALLALGVVTALPLESSRCTMSLKNCDWLPRS